MEVKAHLRNLRIAPRKVRLVVNAVRGLSVVQAENQLRFMNKASALPVLKLLQSAAANAEHNNKLRREQLWIHSITVGDGLTLHRWQPRAMGRAVPIRKRASHVMVVLVDKAPAKKNRKKAAATSTKTASAVKPQSKDKAVKPASKKPATSKATK